ncbi:hypothetical protein KAR91_50945 [Candidatus Pacearchaeota archaeon]|nr:hypothetical protein [Candidatus Pacearchaeota archaeon]
MPNDNLELFDTTDIDHQKILDSLNGDELKSFKHKWPKLLVDISDVVNFQLTYVLKKSSPEDVQKISDGVIIAISKYLGGRLVYLPKTDSLNVALRDISIWREHNGKNENVLKLARKHKLTEIYIYSILKAQLALHVNRIQPQLPLEDSNESI